MYLINEGSIDLPAGWKDQSINIVASSGSSAIPGLTFTITRDEVPWGMKFSEYVASEIDKAKGALTEFKVLTQTDTTISGRAAVEIECTWKAKQSAMHQVITTVDAPKHAMVLTASMPGRMSDSQKAEVRRIVATLRFAEAAA